MEKIKLVFTDSVAFFQGAYHELKLASWLSRQQMIASTIVVLVFTGAMAAYVSIIDRVFLFFSQILFSR